MGEGERESGVRFGRTTIVAVVGPLLDQEVDAIVYPANRRGIMGAMPGAGSRASPRAGAGLRSLGGSAIEREAMARAPLDLGTALVTPAIGLEERGVRAVIHAVIHRAVGETPRVEDIRRAIAAVVAALDRDRLRSVALPLLGIEAVASPAHPEPVVNAIVDELVGGLRRMPGRVDRIVIACRFPDHAAVVSAALDRARERLWAPSP